MASSTFRWVYNVFASSIGESFRRFFHSHLVNELDRNIIDTSKDDEMEITSSSGSRRYDVFPSFSGEDVRKTFLSHLVKALDGRSIKTFIDHGVERSRPIAPELLSAIRESSISIVIFSKNYASSTWCLNELVEIHKCFNDLGQMVIPVVYDVDPSEVRKQTGKFGEAFKLTCERKQRWMQALADIANIAGEDLRNGGYDAFQSFSGEAVCKSFFRHVFKELDQSINIFVDPGMERSRPIGPSLLSAIRESRISINVLSKTSASSTWCMNELVDIHSKTLSGRRLVISIIYDVEVRKLTGEPSDVSKETCEGRPKDQKQRWMQALVDVAKKAGEDSRNRCDDATMNEKIAEYVSNNIITPWNFLDESVGLEAHKGNEFNIRKRRW